ncbi:MAG: DUF4153 domain-containing protein [Planctomycetota bacterium]
MIIFNQSIKQDPRRDALKKLAWIWSVENFLLAGAVVHRMLIYTSYNGMAPMRVFGPFGIASVMVGFALVILKIAGNHSFLWLVQRRLLVPLLAICVYELLPIDWMVHRYNVAQVQ